MSLSPSFSFTEFSQLVSSNDFGQSHEYGWLLKVSSRLSEWQKNKNKKKLGGDFYYLLIYLLAWRGLFICPETWGIARERPEGVHSPGSYRLC